MSEIPLLFERRPAEWVNPSEAEPVKLAGSLLCSCAAPVFQMEARVQRVRPFSRSLPQFHIEALYKLSSRKFTLHNDLY